MLASLTQLVVGHLLDRIELKRLYQSIVLLQFLALLIASVTDGCGGSCFSGSFSWPLSLAPVLADAMIVRYVWTAQCDPALRGCGLRLRLVPSSVAVWLIGPIVKAAGFTTLLWVAAELACITFAVISLLPVPHKPKEADSTR